MITNTNLIIKETTQQGNKEKIEQLRNPVMWFYKIYTIMFVSLV